MVDKTRRAHGFHSTGGSLEVHIARFYGVVYRRFFAKLCFKYKKSYRL